VRHDGPAIPDPLQADVVLREPVELPEQGLSADPQVVVEVGLRIRSSHAAQPVTRSRRVQSPV
jgi:hypothetical protein